MDMGPCPKDRELEDAIDRLIVECDRKIGRALKRLEDEEAKAAIAIQVSEVTQTPEVLELSKQIKEKLKEVDQFGKTDLKIRALEEVEELRTKRVDKQSTLLLDAFNKDRASLPQPLPNPPYSAPLPVPAPDPWTQEMINEKLKKAEDLGEKEMVDEVQKALEEALKKLSARQETVLDSSKYTAVDVCIEESNKSRKCRLDWYNDRRYSDRDWWCIDRKKGAEIMRESQVGTKTKGIAMRGRDYDCRSRDCDRYSDRDCDRDYERSWTYDSRSCHRSRSRSRERSRDHDHHRYLLNNTPCLYNILLVLFSDHFLTY
ncbi:hypothetical protein SLEP1_g37003 [Rubroshorea leprosula]|uniref:Uncharacterized protein n=1 Tax=Rubroshorea leprosula TaxID=152421 RepID=A0AAV5KTP1_9ROSI|nr:hypothetical protein SLEP1_g37003 [Rubroshorea leprosula]